MSPRKGAIVAVAVLVLLAGCASLGGADGDEAGSADETGLDASVEAEADGSDDSRLSEGGGGDESSYAAAAAASRAIVRTGTVELTVGDFESTRDAIAAEADRFGGYVGGSSRTLHGSENVTWTTGQLVVRVPSDRFSEMVAFAEGQGTVESVETETEDVTDRLVELDARLTNLREKRNRLRTFYERANSTSALLSIEERLSSVQGEIEQLTATRQSLEDRVALSTLRISIAEERPEPARSTPDDESTTVAAAFLSSFWGTVDAGYVLLLALASVAPVAIVLGVPGAVGYGLYRRRGRAGPGPAVEPDEPDEDASDASPAPSAPDDE